MKKALLFLSFFITILPVFAQRLATVGILPFEAAPSGVSPDSAEETTRRVVGELRSWGTVTVLSGEDAENAEYLVRGRVYRQSGQFIVRAETSETASGKLLNTSEERAAAPGEISIVSLCAKIAEHVPFPNFLLGKWRSTIQMIDGPVSCVLEFLSNRTVRVERYDTWEHSGTNSLKYQAIGRGTYSYAGYLRRQESLSRREIISDAAAGVYLTLEDALPNYASVSAGGLRLLFDDSKTAFDLVYGGLPCGDNYSGPSVYPNQRVFYTQFTKIE